MTSSATIYGVGLGPGDPELMSVKAARLIAKAGVVAHFRKPGRAGNARTLVNGMLASSVIEEVLEYPVTTEIAFEDPSYNDALRSFYDDCVRRLLHHVEQGRDVTVLCEGDPFFYGSFMHLHSRITGRAPIVVVPGISGMSGCWTASGMPITFGDDVLTVSPGTLAGKCPIVSEGLIADCRIGKGRTIIIADADVLDANRLGRGAKNNLDVLLKELAKLERG